MEGSAPKEVLRYTTKEEQERLENIATESTKAGHPVTVAEVNPDDNSPLKEIAGTIGDVTRVLGSTIEEGLGGANSTTHVVTSKGKIPTSISAGRWFKRRFLGKKAA